MKLCRSGFTWLHQLFHHSQKIIPWLSKQTNTQQANAWGTNELLEILALLLLILNMKLPAGYSPKDSWLNIIRRLFLFTIDKFCFIVFKKQGLTVTQKISYFENSRENVNVWRYSHANWISTPDEWCLTYSKVYWKFHIPTIYNLAIIYPWNLLCFKKVTLLLTVFIVFCF